MAADAAAAALGALADAARCCICSDLYETPLLLRGCAHTFCSACIRQNLAVQEQSMRQPSCPACR